jgi:transposase-like protein
VRLAEFAERREGVVPGLVEIEGGGSNRPDGMSGCVWKEPPMKKVVTRESSLEGLMPVLPGLAAFVGAELREFIATMGMLALEQLLEQERTALAGPRGKHDADRTATRFGYAQGELVLGGRRVRVKRPRVRGAEGEIPLKTWEQFASSDPLNERAMEQVLAGVTMRKYARSLEPLADGIETRGTSRSAVSRRFVAQTKKNSEEWMKRPLGEIDLVAMFIDGVHIDGHVMLVALGVDVTGRKHVLGMREGATENTTSCKELLADLEVRGVRTDRAMLFIIDGAKALASAVKRVFGARALIQRCQVHKTRNVLEQLPESMQNGVRQALRQAFATVEAGRAETMLKNLARRLADDHPGAAGSLREGLEELLTVKRLKLPRALERTLSTTNAIENLMGSIRVLTKRVRRWKDGAMRERWTATALIEASQKFRRLRGCDGMKTFVAVLRARDGGNESTIESGVKAA